MLHYLSHLHEQRVPAFIVVDEERISVDTTYNNNNNNNCNEVKRLKKLNYQTALL